MKPTSDKVDIRSLTAAKELQGYLDEVRKIGSIRFQSTEPSPSRRLFRLSGMERGLLFQNQLDEMLLKAEGWSIMSGRHNEEQ